MRVEPLSCELVAGEDLEAVAVDLDAATNGHVGRSDKGIRLVRVLVLSAF